MFCFTLLVKKPTLFSPGKHFLIIFFCCVHSSHFLKFPRNSIWLLDLLDLCFNLLYILLSIFLCFLRNLTFKIFCCVFHFCYLIFNFQDLPFIPWIFSVSFFFFFSILLSPLLFWEFFILCLAFQLSSLIFFLTCLPDVTRM